MVNIVLGVTGVSVTIVYILRYSTTKLIFPKAVNIEELLRYAVGIQSLEKFQAKKDEIVSYQRNLTVRSRVYVIS